MESLRNMCRVCLKMEDSVPLLNWHIPVKNINENLSYAECFQKSTYLELSTKEIIEKYPSLRKYEHLCFSCAEKLKDVYIFIRTARESDNTLRSNHFKLDTEIDVKYFEWVGVGKDNTLSDIKVEVTDVEPLTILNTNFLGHNTNFEEKTIETSKSKLPNTMSTESIKCIHPTFLPNIKKIIKPSKSEQKVAQVINEQMGCRSCNKSMTKSQTSCHDCSSSSEGFLCKFCPSTFKHRNTLIQHELIHDPTRERKFACGECQRKFFTRGARKKHLKTHAPGREARFHCKDCDQSFLNKDDLIVHRKGHVGLTIQCNFCQKCYFRPMDLEIHLRSHSGDTPFKCDKCEMAFTHTSALKKHLRQHDGVQWKCDCGKEYLYESTLQKHRLEHTGLPLKCSICGKGFADMYKIRRHINGVHKVNISDAEHVIVKIKEWRKREYHNQDDLKASISTATIKN